MTNVEANERYDRQIRLFGAAGQERIEQACVAVLGLGGLGSHVCQQLAYLGIADFILIDDDTVSPTNLNRLVGAFASDLDLAKTAIAERHIKAIQPAANVEALKMKLLDAHASDSLSRASIIVGCFDNDYPRLLVTTMASQLQIPYIDAATDVGDQDGFLYYGGHVLAAGYARGCLNCYGLLDQDEIRHAQMDEQQLEVEARTYGVPVESLRPRTGPSVVTLNGVVASLAATEVMVAITGLRTPKKLQYYYGHSGQMTVTRDDPKATCYYCDNWLA